MKKIILASLVFTMGLTGLQTINTDAATSNVKETTVNLQSEKEQAMAKNTLLRNLKCISSKEWNSNVVKIAFMTSKDQLQAFDDYFYTVILTVPHGSVR